MKHYRCENEMVNSDSESSSKRNKNDNGFNDSVWTRSFFALVEYAKIHGDCNISEQSHFECDIQFDQISFRYQGNLGKWLRDQRVSFANGTLQKDPAKLGLLLELVNAGNRLLLCFKIFSLVLYLKRFTFRRQACYGTLPKR